MRQLELPDGTTMPVLGLGTWRMGEASAARDAEIANVRSAIELGYRLIDTAEMYGEGGAETVVGRALAEALRSGSVRREEMFIVSKVYPHNASRRGTVAACDRSRQRLGLDHIDLYLLHWRGAHPLAETVAALESLVGAGKIRHWGVSNFDIDDLRELGGNSRCAANQVYYSLSQRGAEFGLWPWMRERRMPLMAYSPIDQGGLASDGTLAQIGEARGLTAAQVALAWIVSRPGVAAIPKASSTRHLQDNLAAERASLSEPELRLIESRFPAPRRKTPLAMS
ncbi:MAG TPA: aldo/keto reductase [Ideonella sp.]|jgi:diketogulonate reductase-like aldo/keto reductase|nr:aldo/keto reductase [Ideonella sp.]